MDKTMDKSPEMDKDNQRRRRSSILKSRKSRNPSDTDIITEPTDEDTVTFRSSKRVSFAASNYIKPFMVDSDKDTIWDTTYEEKVNHTDSTHSSQEQTNRLGITTFTSTSTEVRKSEVNRVVNNTIYDECTMEFTATNIVKEIIPIADKENVFPSSAIVKGSILDFVKNIRTSEDGGHNQTTQMELTCQMREATTLDDNSLMSMELELSDKEAKTELTCPVQSDGDKENIRISKCESEVFRQSTNLGKTVYDDSLMELTTANVTKQNPIIIDKENVFPLTVKESIIDHARKLATNKMEHQIEMEMTCQSKNETNVMNMECENFEATKDVLKLERSQVLFRNDFNDTSMAFTARNIMRDILPSELKNKENSLQVINFAKSNESEALIIENIPELSSVSEIKFIEIDKTLKNEEKTIDNYESMMECETINITTDVKLELICNDDVDKKGEIGKFSPNLNETKMPSFVQMTPTPTKQKTELSKTKVLGPERIHKRLFKKGNTPSPVHHKIAKPSKSPALDKLNVTRVIKEDHAISGKIESEQGPVSNEVTKPNSSSAKDEVNARMIKKVPVNVDKKENYLKPPTKIDIRKVSPTASISNDQLPSFVEMTPTPTKRNTKTAKIDATTPISVPKRLLKKGNTPSPVPHKVTKVSKSANGLNVTRVIKKSPVNADKKELDDGPTVPIDIPKVIVSPSADVFPFRTKIPVPAAGRTTPSKDKGEEGGAILYSEKVSKTKLLNTPSFSDLKTPEGSFKVNVNLTSPCLDDTHQLINCTLAKSESYMMASSRVSKNDTFAHSIAPEGSFGAVSLPNITDLSRLDKESPMLDETSKVSKVGNKLSCVNDTYVLNKKRKRLLAGGDNDDDWVDYINQTANVVISDESFADLVEDKRCSYLDEDKRCSYFDEALTFLNGLKSRGKRDLRIYVKNTEELLVEMADTERRIVEFLLTGKFKKFLISDLMDSQDRNEQDSTGDLSQISEDNKYFSPGNSLDRSDDLFITIKEMEKNCDVWQLRKMEDDNIYHFSALCGTVLFKMKLFSVKDHIGKIRTTSNIKDGCTALAVFIHNTFKEKLEKSRLEAVIGSHYDILTLLTYIEMVVRKLDEFRNQFRSLGSFGLTLDDNFIAKFRLHCVQLPALLEVSVDFKRLESLDEKDIVIGTIIGSLNTREFFQTAKMCPKGLDFIGKYVPEMDRYLKERAKISRKK